MAYSNRQRFILEGLSGGYKYAVIICDEFDYTDYAKYTNSEQEVKQWRIEYNNPSKMSSVHKVINLVDLITNITTNNTNNNNTINNNNSNNKKQFHMQLRQTIKPPDRLTY